MGGKRINNEDLLNKKFNKLTVIDIIDSDKKNGIAKKVICRCDCGVVFTGNYNSVIKRGQKACFKCTRVGSPSHGLTKHPIHSRWLGARDRCVNHNNPYYYNYGGRGIKMCSEWDDFMLFYNWAINNGFSKNLELDRIDNNGNYEPNNCRFVTRIKNSNNKRTNVRYDYKGVSYTLAELGRMFNITGDLIKKRVEKLGMTVEDAVSFPRVYSIKKRIALNLQTGIYYYSISEAAKTTHFKETYFYDMLSGRCKNKTNFIYV